MFKNLFLGAAILCSTALAVSAATLSDLTARTDIIPSTTYALNLGGVDESGPASASAILALWNSNGQLAPTNPQMTVDFSVNSSFVTTIELTNISGFSDILNADITGLLIDGLNNFTFAINTDFTGGSPATFAVKDFRVTFTEGTNTPADPLPASFPLFLAALGGLGLMARRRKAA